MIYRLRAVTLLIATGIAAGIAAAQDQSGIDNAISVLEKTLPAGWAIAEQKANEYPWGHHFCDEYTGAKGTMITVVGPKPVNVVWTSAAGERLETPIAKESLQLWFMPPKYRDNWTAWLCFSRPIQPVTVLKTSQVAGFGRPSHRLNSEDEFRREILEKAQFVSWPDSPEHKRSNLSWANWAQDIQRALQKEYPR
jgi:hypothetical protein